MNILENSIVKILDRMFDWATTKGVKLVVGLIALYIGWRLIKRIITVMNSILESRKVDPTLSSFLDAFVNITLKILLIIIVMGYVGIDTAGLAALVASAGLALGLALQGSLSNFAGGVIILLIRPFNVGDFIEGSSHSGVVERIGIFYTHLNTYDNKEILIPNGTLANGSIVNHTSKELRRVDLTFSVSYDEDIFKVKRVLDEIVKNNKLILKEPKPFISVSKHADNSIDFICRSWVKTEDYWTVYFEMLEKTKLRFDEEKISIPYPQMDVHLKRESLTKDTNEFNMHFEKEYQSV